MTAARGHQWLGRIAFPALAASAAVAGLAAPAAEGAPRPASSPTAAAGKARLTLGLTGLSRRTVALCGRARRAAVVGSGTKVAIRLRARRGARRALLLVERCVSGRWRRVRRIALRSARRRSIPLGDLARSGDYRLVAHARVRRGRRVRSRPAYVQVSDPTVDIPVRFPVSNTNRSKVSCQSDGKPYEVAGRLVAPRSVLTGGATGVTLYLHEFSWGAFYWHFREAAHDYAGALAREGHASVVLDRLGYDDSSKPEGNAVCLGSQADVAHQVVGALRSGGYAADGARPVGFSRVGIAGHSVGGSVAEIEAYSFDDVDALMLFAQADQGFKPGATQEAFEQGVRCVAGGEPSDPGGPGSYAYFADTPGEFRRFAFRTADARVADVLTAMINRDPCGDVSSNPAAIASNQANVPSIDVPVLLAYGTGDAVFEQPQAGEDQRRLFSGSRDVTLRFFEGQGHALNFESRAAEVRAVASEWLSRRGL